MRTGVSYMGHHNPKHVRTDLAELAALGCDDVLLAAQENDFYHFTGKLDFTPVIAKELGLRPIAIFWGVLSVFGGGRSSQFLLSHPSAFQVKADGSHHSEGCYVNPLCVGRIQEMIDTIAARGFEGYFIDEPSPIDCFCPSCLAKYDALFGGDLHQATPEQAQAFRRRCVIDYVTTIADYCKANHPQLETSCCVMPHDNALWEPVADIANIDSLGTDIYWVNDTRDVEEMTPIVRDLAAVCQAHGKLHHEWLQAWIVQHGCEPRITAQGDILIREQPDALYIWAYAGQVGTTESCANPELAWEHAKGILRKAKGR